jgi:hypothetical protein
MMLAHIKFTVATPEQRQRVITWLAGRRPVSPVAESDNVIHVWIGGERPLNADALPAVDYVTVTEYTTSSLRLVNRTNPLEEAHAPA